MSADNIIISNARARDAPRNHDRCLARTPSRAYLSRRARCPRSHKTGAAAADDIIAAPAETMAPRHGDYHYKRRRPPAAAKEPKLVQLAQRPLWSVAREGLASFGKIA